MTKEASLAAVFRERFRRVRIRLDPVFAAWVPELLADIPMADRPALEATLVRGKKVRGTLLCLVAEALGGDLDEALPRAAAVELVHAASLIHDDVIDRDTFRRGMPAVWAREGVHRAILIGDVLFASAIAKMSELGREDGLIISRTIAQIARGACLETIEPPSGQKGWDPTTAPPAFYDTIIRLKTAILFEAACRMGANGAGAGVALSDEWGRYGLLVGEAYQIADDLHDLRACLEQGASDTRRLAPLLPPLFHYALGGEGNLFEDSAGGRWQHDALPLIRSTIPALEREIERRLAAAANAVNGAPPGNPTVELLRNAPRELIRLFDEEADRGRPSRR